MRFIDLSCEGMSHFLKVPKWPYFWHVPYFHINLCCLWSSIEPTHSNWSLQNICLPLNVDLLQVGVRLCTFDIRQEYFRSHMLQFSVRRSLWRILLL